MRRVASVRAEAAMLAGLLHDVGKLYILHRANRFPVLLEDMAQLEELLVTWHCGVGRTIVERWGFPATIAAAVDEHENLRREHSGEPDLTDVVQIANLMVNLQDAGEEALQEIDSLPVCRMLHLDHTALRTIQQESEQELHCMEQALGG
jgi:HD-like signal output (HDOD) protein